MEKALSEDILARLVEKVEHRYYGKYRGEVKKNRDPECRGRLRLKVPSVLGKDVVTDWAMPCLPFGGASDQGFFFIPEEGASVWVEFEGGELEYPIWVGTYWSKPGGKSEVPKPADTQKPPTSKIIRTVKGHTIEMADKEGSITITDGVNDNKINLNKDGVIIEDGNGNTITMDVGGVTIKSNKIKLGEGAGQSLVLGDQLALILTTILTDFNGHSHLADSGKGKKTGPPQKKMVILPTTALSKKHKAE